jgi:3-methyladenine DNA glycosylase Mpg
MVSGREYFLVVSLLVGVGSAAAVPVRAAEPLRSDTPVFEPEFAEKSETVLAVPGDTGNALSLSINTSRLGSGQPASKDDAAPFTAPPVAGIPAGAPVDRETD